MFKKLIGIVAMLATIYLVVMIAIAPATRHSLLPHSWLVALRLEEGEPKPSAQKIEAAAPVEVELQDSTALFEADLSAGNAGEVSSVQEVE